MPDLHPQYDPRSVDELFYAALTEVDDAAWDAIRALHWRGTREVLGRATELCRSFCSKERQTGANILGQLGVPDRMFANDCGDVLLQMLRSESVPEVLRCILVAASHLGDVRISLEAVRFARHPDQDVRHAVVLALTGHEDRRTLDALIQLTSDECAHVRDWATFGIGTLSELDTPEIREALFARLSDPDFDTRGEALIGLAQRRDSRVISALKQELASGCVGSLAVEAASLMPSPELYPELIELQEWWDVSPYELEKAIDVCRPA